MGNATQHLYARVCVVMQEVSAVEKGRENKFHDYKYASVDDIYNALRKLMGKHGLSLLLDVEKVELLEAAKGKWLYMAAKLALAAEDGAKEDWSTRYLYCPYGGPQSMEAAVSYIAKQFLRQRFMLATGDKDMDAAGASEGLAEAVDQGAIKTKWLKVGAVEVVIDDDDGPDLRWKDEMPEGWRAEGHPERAAILQAAFAAIRKWLYTLPAGKRDGVRGLPLDTYIKLMPQTGQDALERIVNEPAEEKDDE